MIETNDASIRNVLVVDDEPPARRRLIAMIEAIPGYHVCGEAGHGGEAIVACQRLQPDIVLMDIRMPGMDGLQAATKIAELESPPAIIFCTAYDEHALAAINSGAMAYLLKPIKREPLLEALSKTQKLNRAQLTVLAEREDGTVNPQPLQDDATLWVSTHKGQVRISISEVRAFVADNKYVSAYLPDKEVVIDESLKTLEEQFGGLFLRIHRNALVNPAHITLLDSPTSSASAHRVQLDSVDIAPKVSRRLLPEVRRLIKSQRQ